MLLMHLPLQYVIFRESMVEFVRGEVISIKENGAIFDLHGVGVFVFLTPDTMVGLKEGETHSVFVHLVFKQDGFEVYGFGSEEEKRAFLSLLSVQKVGARTAMNILSGLGYTGFIKALEEGDVSRFSGIKGVGEKTAKRIVLELKGKLEDVKKLPEEAVSALIKLGFTRQEAEEGIKKVLEKKKDLKIEELIKEVLKSGWT